MKKLKALVHAGKSGLAGLSYTTFQEVEPKSHEVRVKIKTAGLNHRDLFVIGRRNEQDSPLIIGSDGAGIIDAVGERVENFKIGDEVVINPGLRWIEKTEAPPKEFEILGNPDHGTFAEKIVISSDNVELKPTYLSWEEAGVFSLAALTAYRAIFTRAGVKEGDTVFIPGIGSGVALFLLQFAKAVNAKVYVSSRSEIKCQKALELGADRAINSNSDWSEALGGEKVDVVFESIGEATFNRSLEQLRKGGTMVTFGATTGDQIEINLRNFFYGQFNLLGTTMGSATEYREMLKFMETHQIKPVIDEIFSIKEFEEAFTKMDEGKQLGKIGFCI